MPAARSSNAVSAIKETRAGEAVLSHLKKAKVQITYYSPDRSISFDKSSSKKLTKQKRKHRSAVKMCKSLKRDDNMDYNILG